MGLEKKQKETERGSDRRGDVTAAAAVRAGWPWMGRDGDLMKKTKRSNEWP
jgi:hypothetical protein